MPLINDAGLHYIIRGYRLAWYSGMFGGGKTSLALKMAERFLQAGYHLVSNLQCVWNEAMEDIKWTAEKTLKTVVIFDEGGLSFESNRQIKTMAAYLRKMDVILMFPSFWAPARAAAVVEIAHCWGLMGAGIPMSVFRWDVRMRSQHEHEYFIWWNPKEMWGLYKTGDTGADPQAIMNWLIAKSNEKEYLEGHKHAADTVSGMGTFRKAGEEPSIEGLEDIASSIIQASEVIEAVSSRRRGRGGF